MKRSIRLLAAVLACGFFIGLTGCMNSPIASHSARYAAPQRAKAYALAVTLPDGSQPSASQWAAIQSKFAQVLASVGAVLVTDLAEADEIIRVAFTPSETDPDHSGRVAVLGVRSNPVNAIAQNGALFPSASFASYNWGSPNYSFGYAYGYGGYGYGYGYGYDPYGDYTYGSGGISVVNPPVTTPPTTPGRHHPPGTPRDDCPPDANHHHHPPLYAGGDFRHPPQPSRYDSPSPSYTSFTGAERMAPSFGSGSSYSRSQPSYSSPSYNSSSSSPSFGSSSSYSSSSNYNSSPSTSSSSYSAPSLGSSSSYSDSSSSYSSPSPSYSAPSSDSSSSSSSSSPAVSNQQQN
jgi:hypothetical protein